MLPNSDIEKYKAYLDDFDMSDEQKVNLIKALGKIMQSFVDRAWGNDSVQLALRPSKKD